MSSVGPGEHKVEKKRFITLDALRGVAAVMVVLYHTGFRLGTWMPRFGYLAVDLFFLLSGFVLAYSYEPRFRQGLRRSEFLVTRIVRLYPLYVFGLVLGTGVALLNLKRDGVTLDGDVIGFGLGLVGFPSYVGPHGPLYVFAMNPPFWSLFFEFWVANVAFMMVRGSLNGKVLGALILICGVSLLIVEKLFYTSCVGFEWHSFAWGFPRVGFSFFCGVAIARLHRSRPPRLKLPSWVFVLILPALLSLPLTGGMAHCYELACVFLLFPAIVYWGAEAVERHPWVGAALGDASYALYTVHYPLLVAASSVLSTLAMRPSLPVVQFLFVVLVATLAWGLSHVDTRVRARLLVRLRPSPPARAAQGQGLVTL